METRAKCKTPIIYGSAKRTSNGNEDENDEHSISLKDLSMAQIFKLAEERAKNSGTIKRTPDNFSHKRIAASESVTREQSLSRYLIAPKNLKLTCRSDQSDDNDEFFENLLKKMTAEKFIPVGQMDRSKKRTCLWDKENSSNSKKPKRRKVNGPNSVPNPPTIASFKERLLFRQCNNGSSAQMGIQSQREGFGTQKQGRKPAVCKKSTLDLIQEDINMEATSSNFTDYGSTQAGKNSLNDSFRWNGITDNGTSISSCETIKLRHNCTIDRFNREPGYAVESYDYHKKPYLDSNLSNRSYLSTIEVCHEPSVAIPSPTYDGVVTEFHRPSNVSPDFTLPLSPELGDCNVDNFAIVRDETISWQLLQSLTYSSSDLNDTTSCLGEIV